MESTWETRDLPVLEAVVRYFGENPMQPGSTLGDIDERIGMDPNEAMASVWLARSQSRRSVHSSAP
jgi:hypothetical protein